MVLRLEPVVDSRARKSFVALARQFRTRSPNYVPPLTGEIAKLLDPARNPALKTAKQALWIARDEDGKARGRIAATFDPRHAENLGERAGWFGFFDADSAETTVALLEQAWNWQLEQGAESMLGPADPDTNHECGCLIEGQEHLPYLMMPHNPPQYGEWIEQAGLEKAKDLLAYETQGKDIPMERMKPVVERSLSRGGFEIKKIYKKQLPQFVRDAHSIYNAAWQDNWGFLPMTLEEFQFEADGLKFLLEPDFALVAYHKGKPAGFILGLIDVNLALHPIQSRLFPFGIFRLPFLLKKVRRFRTVALGILPEFRGRGLDIALVYQLTVNGTAKGFFDTELSWILEDNEAMNRLATGPFGGKLTKRYRIYRKKASK